MKKLLLLLPLLSLNCFAEENNQDTNYSIGLGMGAMYSGIGANVSFVSKNDLKYISVGCTGYGSVNGAECGIGAGWITTELFDFGSNKHGFGIYGGVLGEDNIYTFENGNYTNNKENVLGVGLSYTYFMNGIDKSGLTLGLSVHITNTEFENNTGGFLQVGYQF